MLGLEWTWLLSEALLSFHVGAGGGELIGRRTAPLQWMAVAQVTRDPGAMCKRLDRPEPCNLRRP